MWYTTADARRDAEKQSAQRDGNPTQECSSFCAPGEQCAITADGGCDVRAEIAALQDKCARLHAALVAITNVPAGTVLTDYQMRLIARNAIAT